MGAFAQVLDDPQDGVGHAVHLGQETLGDYGDSHVPTIAPDPGGRVTPRPTLPEQIRHDMSSQGRVPETSGAQTKQA
ncbi:hypothetical protein Amsp01_071250 [Amycolatopsis sp. NBRC 101858]|nr:hypothetical protein Amsp01_071250 [Amycolatopsis sp. NBRC 101858]